MREAIILCGGLGTRLRSVVSDVPKSMAPINGAPFLTYLLDELSNNEFKHIILATGYKYDVIMSYYGNEYADMTIDYSNEDHPLGTGGAIVKAMNMCYGDDVVVLNGDTLFKIDYNSLFDTYNSEDTNLVCVLRRGVKSKRFGKVVVDKCGKIVDFVEKSAQYDIINGGIYLLNKHAFDMTNLPDKFSFEHDFLEKEYKNQSFYGYVSSGYFIDIGIPRDYSKATKDFPNLYE